MSWSKIIPANPVVAVTGATGAVGTEMLKVLEDRDFPAARVKLLASARSAGSWMAFQDGELLVEELTEDSFADVDIALFALESEFSEKYRDIVTAAGAVMIDNSSAFRMTAGVPLVVPEVNPEAAKQHSGLIANPNCSTIQMVVALDVLRKLAPIKRVVVSTYQAASGAGIDGMHELYDQTRQFLNGEELDIKKFAYQIAFNCIPQIDVFLDDRSTKEEWKMVAETRKIMDDPSIGICANCVRVPVLRSHAEMINVEFSDDYSLDQVFSAFEAADGIVLMDDLETKTYPMPGLLGGTDKVYVGRIRRDDSVPFGLNFWCVADQLRKGAALNAVQIAELLLP
jgi:aspartate-semialdehyde dehydrogenase